MSADGVTVGVLSTHSSKETKAICNAVDALGHEARWLRERSVTLAIEGDAVAAEPDVDVLANRLLLSNTEQPAELLGLLAAYEPLQPVCNSANAALTAFHKFAAAVTLAEAGVRVPDALLSLSPERLDAGRDDFGEDAVYKTAIGTHGGGTWRVGRDEPVNPMVGQRVAFLQDLVGTDDGPTRDMRVYVVGGEIVDAMYRYAPETDWRTNVALGGDVEPADPDPEARELALAATEAIGLDYAGVDLIEGPEGWYVLEVNPTAGFRGLFRATGTSPAPHVAALAIERAGGEVDRERVAEVAATLDDSRPAGAEPRPMATGDEAPVIGYTEEVVVSGTSGTERVVAKSDTGASRTSVDTNLAARIGAGPIKQQTTVKSGSVKQGTARPVVDVVVGIGGTRHTVSASLTDRSHMSHQLLLGRDILEHYSVDVTRRHDDGADREEEEEEAGEE